MSFKEENKMILKGLQKAYEKMVLFKKSKGTPLVVSEDGFIKKVDPNKVLPTIKYSKS